MMQSKGSILSDGEIREALLCGELKVSSTEEGFVPYVGPSSMDLHLDNKAHILSGGTQFNRKIHANKKEEMADLFKEYNDWEEITIHPNEFYILSSIERIQFPNDMVGFLQGRSSIARIGINIHAAGFFDCGFEGTATLEVTNFTNYPIVLPKGIRICQMVFMRTGKPAEVPYGMKKDSKYQGQTGPVVTRVHEDYEN